MILIVVALSMATEVLNHCLICNRCLDCSAEVKNDHYIDQIDALLQKRIEDLGYPVHINRTTSSTQNTYLMKYSSGLGIELALKLDDMQIQLLSYSYNTPSTTSSTSTVATTSTQTETKTVQKTKDGYTIVNVNADDTVKKISSFMEDNFKTSKDQFALSGA